MNLTLGIAQRRAAERLAAAGCEEAALDARVLLAHVTGLDAAMLVADAGRPLSDAELVAFQKALDRRCSGEPVARITGHREFWTLDLALVPATLVPRPETETVVEAVLAMLQARGKAGPRILDLGTGSGAILLALLAELPGAFGIGLDRSFDACRAARKNAGRNGLGGRAAFVCGDFSSGFGVRFDAVVSNPPYIPGGDIAGLAREVREHDPLIALDGGADGLDAYRLIARMLPGLLAPGGIAVLEFGIGQGGDIARICEAQGLRLAGVRADLAGIDRVICLETA